MSSLLHHYTWIKVKIDQPILYRTQSVTCPRLACCSYLIDIALIAFTFGARDVSNVAKDPSALCDEYAVLRAYLRKSEGEPLSDPFPSAVLPSADALLLLPLPSPAELPVYALASISMTTFG